MELKGSIRKWEGVVAGTIQDLGYDNCPLCKEFPDRFCTDCPVKNHTGLPGCFRTPYHEFDRLSDDGWARSPKAKAAAEAELKFLKSLLP